MLNAQAIPAILKAFKSSTETVKILLYGMHAEFLLSENTLILLVIHPVNHNKNPSETSVAIQGLSMIFSLI